MLASSGQSCWRGGLQGYARPSWLQVTLADFEKKMQSLCLNSAENDDNADSFGERAENYYRKRPQLLDLLNDLYYRYLSLADRYCLLKQQSQISTVQFDDEDNYDRQMNNYHNSDSDAESTLSYQPPHAEKDGDETLCRRKAMPESDVGCIRVVGKTADETTETNTRKNLRQLAEPTGHNSQDPTFGSDEAGKLFEILPEKRSGCRDIPSGIDQQDKLVEKSAVMRFEALSGNQSHQKMWPGNDIRATKFEEATVCIEGTQTTRKIGQESDIIVRKRAAGNSFRETGIAENQPGFKEKAEMFREIPPESDLRNELTGSVCRADLSTCSKLTVAKSKNHIRRRRENLPEPDAKYRHAEKPGRKRCWEVVVSGRNHRETLPEAERLVGELVAKTVECEVLVEEVGVLEQCQTESFRKIDLQRSLLEVLESERLILLIENGRLEFRISAIAEENRGLVSEMVLLKRKANELGRCLVKMRDEHRVCMLRRKVEDLEGEIDRLEKKNSEYQEKLVRREEGVQEVRSAMERVKAENVRLQDLMRETNKGRDGVGWWLDRAKVFICGFADSQR